jgi:hypothetical protein
MRAVFVVFSTLICVAFVSNTTEASQDPTPLPMDSSAPGLPQSDPSNLGASDLLPESSALPPEKNAEIRTKAVPAAFSKSAAKTRQKRSEGSRTAKSKVHQAHHRSHRYAHHTSRRHRLYFDEYGPPEMGPYGPPPYGPPAWWPGPPPGAY